VADPLAKRLKLLREALRRRGLADGAVPSAEAPAAAGTGAETGLPDGRDEEGGLRRAGAARTGTVGVGAEGPVTGLEGWERIGEFTFTRTLRFASPLAGEEISPLLLPRDLGPGDLVFFDTETTGISGGAGTLVFLIGLGRLEGSDLAVEQVFLTDFPGETEFLQRIRPVLGSGGLFVSYNGRAFDSHLLRTRFLLNRLPFELQRHNDLLYWARRLWRRVLSNCSLGNVEREILGIERELDVPGFEVPDIYLEYLRQGWSPRMPLVWAHNLQDVRTLAGLFGRLNRILLERGAPKRTDLTALGSYLVGHGLPRGLELLARAFTDGDGAAGRALGRHYKRLGRWEEAAEVWRLMLERGPSLFAAVELAKYSEHRLKDAAEALAWVERIGSWKLPLDQEARSQLAARRERLRRKLAGRPVNPGSS
jgi:pentatricopeptide repeat protein